MLGTGLLFFVCFLVFDLLDEFEQLRCERKLKIKNYDDLSPPEELSGRSKSDELLLKSCAGCESGARTAVRCMPLARGRAWLYACVGCESAVEFSVRTISIAFFVEVGHFKMSAARSNLP